MEVNIFCTAALNLTLRSIPAHILAYYPFYDRLRFPVRKILFRVSALQMIQALFYGYFAAGGSERIVEFLFMPLYMALYFYSVRDDRFKLLFLYLFVTDYTIILRGFSVFFEASLFYRRDLSFYSLRSTLIHTIATAVSLPFILHFFTRARKQVFSVDAPLFWRTVWMVPAFTTAIVMIFTCRFRPEQVRSLRFLLARTLLLLCVFVIYAILLESLDIIRNQAALAERAAVWEHLLNLQQMQHKQLMQHMEETKIARHNLRQHLKILHACLESNDTEALKTYLNAYEKKLPADIRWTFCSNFSVNAVLTYYAEKALQYEIEYDVRCNLSEKLPVQETEICEVLGNLLENAVEACQNVKETSPFIHLRSECTKNHLVLTIDNSCSAKPIQQNGRFLSTHHEGYGIGTCSVRTIAEQTGGTAEFSYKDGVFFASVLLYRNFPDNDKPS